MFGQSIRPSSKAQQPKLRAACDTCFLAKVKCSKTRPVCSRCLTCGTECKYSPSSRSGKPKSESNRGKRSPSSSKHTSMSSEQGPIQYTTQSLSRTTDDSPPYSLETDWSAMPSPPQHRTKRRSTSSGVMPVIRDEESSENIGIENDTEIYDAYTSWMHNTQADPNNIQYTTAVLSHSKSLDNVPITNQWYEHADSTYYSSSSPSIDLTPSGFMSNSHSHPHSPMAPPTTCNCFNTCLQALQALHNSDTAISSSTFDVILTVNQQAVETCSTMLNCPICINTSGSSLRSMLLGTIFGRIASTYQDASRNYFGLTTTGQGGSSQPLPLTFGTYRVATEDVRWLQVEIFLRDLEKLRELFGKFQEAILKSDEDVDAVHSAVTNRLCQSLHVTSEALKKHKDFLYGRMD